MRFFPHGIEGGLRLTCAMLGGGGAGGAGGGGSSSRRCWCQMSVIVSWVLVKCVSGLKGEIVGEDGKMARYSTFQVVVEQKGTILSLSALSRFLLAKDAPAPRREVSPGHSGVSVRSIVLIGDFSGLPGSVRCT